MDYIKICVIGAGRWEKNHIKTLYELDALGGIVEPDFQQRNKMNELYPEVNCLSSIEDAVENKPLLYYEKDQNENTNLNLIKNKRSKTINYEATLPLKNELKYFIDIIKGKTIDKGTLNEGLDVVKILEMATNSLTAQNLSVY